MKTYKENKYRILSTIAKYSFIVVIFFSLVLPIVVLEDRAMLVYATDSNTGNNSTPDSTTGNKNPVQVLGGDGIENPLPGVDDIPSFIVKVITVVLYIGVPIITLAIIYSGFLFVSAQGNPEKITTAKNALLFTVIGAAILLGSFVIANAIKGTVEDISSDNV